MGLHRMLLLQLLLVALASATTRAPETPELAAKPGCPNKCGDLTIPYPFGIKDGCYLNEDFNITCYDSLDSPLAFLGTSALKVSNISLEGQLTILSDVASDCYYYKNRMLVSHNQYHSFKSFWAPPFTISNTQNKFVAIGCDTFATILGYQGRDIYLPRYQTGCVSLCNNIEHVANESSCSGIGCCQITIPPKQWLIEVELKSLYNHSLVWHFNPCSYAFVVEEKWFNFSNYSFEDLKSVQEVPMVIDWTIGNETCKIAQNNKTSYACKAKRSTCKDEIDNGSGYRCWCSEGYQGNPYLLNGCQDIDECKNSSLNQCVKLEYCKNNEGNYSCHCPKGYRGDGRKDPYGEGCNPNPLPFKEVVLGIGISILLLLVGGSWLYLILKKRKLIKLKEKFFEQNGGLMLQQQLSKAEISSTLAKIFSAEELKKATNNFDENRIVGRGGFGTVYRGVLADNSVVAIKKSKIIDRNQIDQFINEVVVLSQINHRNVVRLLGCCLETEVPLLVYEFITNGTLFEHIHNKSKASAMSWGIRLRVATETAEVLSYLHSTASTSIIHRDIKSTNILLDDNYTAKVSDFGASRLVPQDETQLSTMVQGTLGYLDPEYLNTSQLTEKSDVYSFGVVLVELFTGKKALSFQGPEEEKCLAMYFLTCLKENCLDRIVENCIVNEENIEQVKEVANLAKRCLRVNGEERPTMKEVANELERLRVMKKHSWVEVEVNLQETEYSPGESSDNFYHGGSANTSAGYDSMKNQIILPGSDGR